MSGHGHILPRWLRREPNRCYECRVEIPRVARAYYGNKYRPRICVECHAKLMAKMWQPQVSYVGDAAIRAAARPPASPAVTHTEQP